MNRRAVIVHGYTGHPDKNWFPWLKRELEGAGIPTAVPIMPNADQPRLDEWLPHLAETIGEPDQGLVLIGHSLGSITILQYLGQLLPDARIGRAVLVAGFARPLQTLPILDNFFVKAPDPTSVQHAAGSIIAINSDNDHHVPLEEGHYLRDQFGAELTVFPNGSHLNEAAGFTELPAVRDAVLRP